MVPSPLAVQSDETLPEKVDVAIIGGGIIGAATALELSERGVSVALFEKGKIAGEQSSRNWGWCRQMGRDAKEMPLIIESLKLWRNMNERIGAETGFKTCGTLYMEETDTGMAKLEKWVEENGQAYQISSSVLTGKELDAIIPNASNRYKGGFHTPSDGRAEPQRAAPLIVEAARKKGAKIFTNCAVRGLETEAGTISEIITEKGPVKCSQVVLAGGAWSRRFLGNLGIKFPQLYALSNVQATEPMDIDFKSSFAGGKYAVRKRYDGGFSIAYRSLTIADIIPASFQYFKNFLPALSSEWPKLRLRFGSRFFTEAALASKWSLDNVSPFEKIRILDPEPVKHLLYQAFEDIQKDHPAFKKTKIVNQWGGLIDVTPDAVPVISPLEKVSGLYLASGFSGHGFGIGPAAGHLMADLVTGKTPIVDPEPFRYNRMIDGSKLMPGNSI